MPKQSRKVRAAGKVRRAIATRESNLQFTTARSTGRLIEALLKTLDDYHYTRTRTPKMVSIMLIDGRILTVTTELSDPQSAVENT